MYSSPFMEIIIVRFYDSDPYHFKCVCAVYVYGIGSFENLIKVTGGVPQNKKIMHIPLIQQNLHIISRISVTHLKHMQGKKTK